MSKKEVGGADDLNGGADSDKDKKDVVAYETYKKTVDEVKSLKERLKAIEDEKKVITEKNLKEQNDYKTLYEQKETALKDATSKLENFQKDLTDSIKISAFNKHLGGKLKHDDYIDFVELEKIVIHPETKKVDPESVKTVVASFLKSHSALVEVKRGNMPQNHANGMDGKRASGQKGIAEMSSAELEADIVRRVQAGEIKF